VAGHPGGAGCEGGKGWWIFMGLWSVAMIGRAGFDAGDSVELFEEDEEGEFVLEGEGGEGDHAVGCFADLGTVSIGCADEEGDAFHIAAHFE